MGKYFNLHDRVTGDNGDIDITVPQTEEHLMMLESHRDAVTRNGKVQKHKEDNPIPALSYEGHGLQKFKGKFTTEEFADRGLIKVHVKKGDTV
jgi:hypothetical protein